MESSIKHCFNLFVRYMGTMIKDIKTYDTTTMTVEQIRYEIDIIYMKYILVSTYTISETAVGTVAYKHLRDMVDKTEIKTLKQEIDDLKVKFADYLFHPK